MTDTLVAWFDASAGVSGDMILGALVDGGVPIEVLRQAVTSVTPGIELRAESTSRHGIGATRVHVEVDEAPQPHRHLGDILALFTGLAQEVRSSATATFELLAQAEAAVHRSTPEQVHFHEVGARDAIADIVGGCAGVHWLRSVRGVHRLGVGPIEAGSGGRVRSAHGLIPVPVPAVVEIARLRSLTLTGALPYEAGTPTGVALLATLTDGQWGMPALTPVTAGTGAGGRDPAEAANLLRLVVGAEATTGTGLGEPEGTPAVHLECNVDDFDLRLWPDVLASLFAAGVADAWLAPILMKKGRPAHTLHVLVAPDLLDRVRALVYTSTSTIGVRETPVTKRPLQRTTDEVEVEGGRIGVKLAWLGDRLVNVSVEYDDVLRVAQATGQPAKSVLARAEATAHRRFA